MSCFIESPGNALLTLKMWSCAWSLAAVTMQASSFRFPCLVRKGKTSIKYNTHSIKTFPQKFSSRHTIRNYEIHRIYTGRERAFPPVWRKATGVLWLWWASLDLILSLNPAPYRTDTSALGCNRKAKGLPCGTSRYKNDSRMSCVSKPGYIPLHCNHQNLVWEPQIQVWASWLL